MNFVDENVILQKLIEKRHAIKNYRLIKSIINEGWVEHLKSSLNQREFTEKVHDKIQKCLYNNLGKGIMISLKQIQIILNNDSTFKPKYIAKWESTYNINLDWKNNGLIYEKLHSVTQKNNFNGK